MENHLVQHDNNVVFCTYNEQRIGKQMWSLVYIYIYWKRRVKTQIRSI